MAILFVLRHFVTILVTAKDRQIWQMIKITSPCFLICVKSFFMFDPLEGFQNLLKRLRADAKRTRVLCTSAGKQKLCKLFAGWNHLFRLLNKCFWHVTHYCFINFVEGIFPHVSEARCRYTSLHKYVITISKNTNFKLP